MNQQRPKPQRVSSGERHRTMEWLVGGVLAAVSLAVVVNVEDSTMLKPPLLIAGAAVIVCAWLMTAAARGHFRITVTSVHAAAAAYLAICALSLLFAPNPVLGADWLLRLACCILVFAAAHEFFDSPASAARAGSILAGITALAAIIGLAQDLLPPGSVRLLTIAERQTMATFGNSTYFGGFLAFMLPVVSGLIGEGKGKRTVRILLVVLAGAIVLLLIRTEARSAWAGAVAGMMGFAFLKTKSWRTRALGLGAIVFGCVVVYLLFPGVIQKRIGAIFAYDPTSSVARRLYFYEAAWKAFVSAPLFGNGIGNFIVFLPRFRSPDYWMAHSEDIVPHTHNEYLEILSETGLIGFAAFVMLLVLYYRRAWKAQPAGPLGIGFMCGVLAVLVDNLASLNLRTVPVAAAFWAVMGVSLRGSGGGRTFDVSLPAGLRRVRWLPAAAVAVFLLFCARSTAYRLSTETVFLRGTFLQADSRKDEASAEFREVIGRDSAHAQARFYLANNLVGQGKYREARDLVRSLLADYPWFPKARILLAISYFELRDTTAALAELEREIAVETTPDVLYYASSVAFRAKKPDLEFEYVRRLLHNSVESRMPDHAVAALERMKSLATVERASEIRNLALALQETFLADSAIVSAAHALEARLYSP